jgi:hypothetical protein
MQQMSSDEDDEEENTSLLSSASSISDCIQMKTIQDHIVTLIETKRSENLETCRAGGGRGDLLFTLSGLRRVFLILKVFFILYHYCPAIVYLLISVLYLIVDNLKGQL